MEYRAIEPPSEDWEKVGGVALYGFSLLAMGAFVPALCRKKQRVYTTSGPAITSGANIAVSQGEESVVIQELAFPEGTPEERAKVQDILRTTARVFLEKSWFAHAIHTLLYAKEGLRLSELGDQVDHIHPFSFLSAVPKESIKQISLRGMSIAKSRVLGGIQKGLDRDYNNLERYIPSFAQAMGKEVGPIQQHIRARAWKKLTCYLFDLKDW